LESALALRGHPIRLLFHSVDEILKINGNGRADAEFIQQWKIKQIRDRPDFRSVSFDQLKRGRDSRILISGFDFRFRNGEGQRDGRSIL
jgi:hypothetical protein